MKELAGIEYALTHLSAIVGFSGATEEQKQKTCELWQKSLIGLSKARTLALLVSSKEVRVAFEGVAMARVSAATGTFLGREIVAKNLEQFANDMVGLMEAIRKELHVE